jgi:hypothetical protein
MDQNRKELNVYLSEISPSSIRQRGLATRGKPAWNTVSQEFISRLFTCEFASYAPGVYLISIESLSAHCLAAGMEQDWKETNKIEGDLAGERPLANLRQISGKTSGSQSGASGCRRRFARQLAKVSLSPYDLPLQCSQVVVSGISPASLRVDHLAGHMHSRLCFPILKSSSTPPMCLHGPGGSATVAPFMARMEAPLGINRSSDEIVARPGSILAPGPRGSSRGTNARSNGWSIPRSVRARPRQPLKFQVIACARGSDGR